MAKPTLAWLPDAAEFPSRIKNLRASPAAWSGLVSLAGLRLDFLRTGQLDDVMRRDFATPPPGLSTRPVRLGFCSKTIEK